MKPYPLLKFGKDQLRNGGGVAILGVAIFKKRSKFYKKIHN